MKPRLKTRLIRSAVVVSVLLSAFYGLSLWNKSDFCEGWARHYLLRSIDREKELLRAIEDDRRADANGLKRAVASDAIIAEKYLSVAHNPWRAYPRNPLVTEEEIEARLRVEKK